MKMEPNLGKWSNFDIELLYKRQNRRHHSVINLAKYIDHTILKPTTTRADIEKLCEEADTYRFASVCVPPPMVSLSKQLLSGNPAVKIATVIGFPFGYSAIAAKQAETEQALSDGADELDVVINILALKNGDLDWLEREMSLLTQLIHRKNKIVKVIIESGILSDEEILQCCRIYAPMQVDFMKTSTGYAEKGASVEAVKLLRANLPELIRIKASGGIRDYEFASRLIDAGASRLGCSASVAIVEGAPGGKAGY